MCCMMEDRVEARAKSRIRRRESLLVADNTSVNGFNLTVLEKLNAPVEVPKTSGIMKDRSLAKFKNQGRVLPDMGKQNKRKWKRLQGKENIVTRCAGRTASDLRSGMGKRI